MRDFKIRYNEFQGSSFYLKWYCVLLFLSALLRHLSVLFTPLCFIIIFYMQLRNGRTYVSNVFFILISCFTLFILDISLTGLATLNNAIWYTLPSFLGLVIGYNFVFKGKDAGKSYFIILFFMMFSLACPNLIITILDILKTGLVNPERTLAILSGDDEAQTITSRTIELSLAIAGISMFILRKTDAPQQFVRYYIIIGILAELCTLHYVSRTGIAIMLISILFGLLYKYKLSFSTISIIGICLLIFFLVITHTELYNVFADREIEGSDISDAGGRTGRWLIGFTSILNNVLGYRVDDWYAHNFWLDFGREGGLLPFLLLCVFSLYIIIISLKIQQYKVIPSYMRYNILLFSGIFFISFFTEPVHTGTQISMYFYFIFSGIVLRIKKKYEYSLHRSFSTSKI